MAMSTWAVDAAVKKTGTRNGRAKASAPSRLAASHRQPAPKANPYRCSPYVGAFVVDADSGRVIFSDGADRQARPASVTKLMTALLVLDDVKAGKYGLDAMVSASANALRMEPSIIGFMDGKPPRQVS